VGPRSVSNQMPDAYRRPLCLLKLQGRSVPARLERALPPLKVVPPAVGYEDMEPPSVSNRTNPPYEAGPRQRAAAMRRRR